MAEDDQKTDNPKALVKKLTAAGWGAFFIWLGISLLANVSRGVGAIGLGVIVLGGEAVRRHFRLAVDWFWLMMGIAFVLWGICESLKIQLGASLWPIFSIALGLAILITALRPHPRH